MKLVTENTSIVYVSYKYSMSFYVMVLQYLICLALLYGVSDILQGNMMLRKSLYGVDLIISRSIYT